MRRNCSCNGYNRLAVSLRSCRFLRLLDQLLQSCVNRLLAGLADPLASNRALVIDDVKRWRGGEIPLTVDGTIVVNGPPTNLVLRHHFLEFTRIVGPGIDADEGEWLFFQFRYERPLVRPGGPSRQSEFAPEIEQHHLAAIVAQFELRAVLVLAFDVRGNLTDGEVADVV